MGWNPANWQITDTLQGQQGGFDLNPLDNGGIIGAPTTGTFLNTLSGGVTAPITNTSPANQTQWNGSNLGGGTSTAGGGDTTIVAGARIGEESPVSLGGVDAESALRAQQTSDALRAYADRENALRGLLGRAGATRQTGLTKIGDEYNANKTTGLAGYDDQRMFNTKDRLSNVDRINQKAQTGYNSLRRILGMSGSANQSAKFGIGQAVSKVASQDRAGAFDTSGRNERGIDLAQNTWLTDLNKRKADAEYGLEQDVLGNEQDVYGELATLAGQKAQLQGGNYDSIVAAQAPYQAEISNRDNILSGLFEKYRPTLNAVAERPELGKYTVDRAAVQANQQQAGDFSPYSQLLRKRLTESV